MTPILDQRIADLKIDKQITENHQAKLTVEIEPEVLEQSKRRAARRLAQRVKIPGFRPGKAPYPIIVRQIGEGAILEEAIEILVDDIYPKVIEQAEIEPYGPGALENIEKLDPPTFIFSVPLKAEVELGDYKSIRLDYIPEPVAESAVEDVLADLQARQAILEPVERKAEEGDVVHIHLSGVHLDPDGGEPTELVRERDFSPLIPAESTDQSDEWPFPGFARQLVGLAAGDEKTLEHQFGEDSEYTTLRGAQTSFTASVIEVRSRTLPALDDDFAQSVNADYSSLDDLKAAVRKDLEDEAQRAYNESYDERVVDEVVAQSSFKYPEQMLEHEIDHVVERMENELSQQGMDLDLYLKTREMDMGAFREEVRPVAERRMKKSLVLMELSDVEKIAVSPDELQEETSRTLGSLSRMMPPKEFQKILQEKDSSTNLVGNIMMDMIVRRTLERVRRIASGMPEPEEAIETAPAEGEQPQSAVESLPEAAETEAVETAPAEEEQPQPAVESLPEAAETDAAPDQASEPVDSVENTEN